MTFPGSPRRLFLHGEWVDAVSGATFDVVDPANERVIDSVALGGPIDVDQALDSAEIGFEVWRRTDPWTRSRVLRDAATLLREWAPHAAEIMTEEQGKPLREAEAEWRAAADQFDWHADEARRVYGRVLQGPNLRLRQQVWREPIGIVAAFASWNFPALLPSRKIAPAIAAGCSVIVRPSEEAPRSTLLIAEAFRQAGLPAGVLNVVSGRASETSTRLLESGRIRKLSLTGSVPVGQTLLHAAADGIIQVSMELGGHAPVLVFPDADPVATAKLCVASKYRNAGQVCASPSRFIVHEDSHEAFTAAFVEASRRLTVGDGRDPATDVGPLTSARRVAAAEAMIADAVTRGAQVAVGGQRARAGEPGYFFAPTVLSDVSADAEIMSEEPFAPVAPLLSFRETEEALRLANSTPYGLASYVFTKDLATAYRAAEELQAGMVAVNHMTVAAAEAPFGGIRHSGFGREGGSEGMLDYTVAKYVSMDVS